MNRKKMRDSLSKMKSKGKGKLRKKSGAPKNGKNSAAVKTKNVASKKNTKMTKKKEKVKGKLVKAKVAGTAENETISDVLGQDVQHMSVEDFMGNFTNLNASKAVNGLKGNKKKASSQKGIKEDKGDSDDDPEYLHDETVKHKNALNKLRETDPEFFAYVNKKSTNLLDFDIDFSDDEKDVHELPSQLEVASDDSDDDGTDKPLTADGKIPVTMKLINEWTVQLQSEKPSVRLVKSIVRVFRVAVSQVQQKDEKVVKKGSRYYVPLGPMFNAVMRLCITHLPTVFNKLMKKSLPVNTKAKGCLASYLFDLMKIIRVVNQSSILLALLKHVVTLIPFIAAEPTFAKNYCNLMTILWSRGEEANRVLAFIIIMNIVKMRNDTEFLQYLMKRLYLSYVTNCKFTSPTTWPSINFMKRSLVELFVLNDALAYRCAFLFIRQLAMHLRKALSLKKEEYVAVVYNWQYIHCLGFFAQLLSTMHASEAMRQLIYPLVQVIIGTIKLKSIESFYPLRFHCIRALILLSEETNTFIPILPFLLEVFDLTDFNKHRPGQNWDPVSFNCILKLSKSQLEQRGFLSGLVDHFYELLMDYLHSEAHRIGFPELVFPALSVMRPFLKKCNTPQYCRIIRELVKKMVENSEFISSKRSISPVALNDSKAIDEWEKKHKLNNPFKSFYEKYKNLRENELVRDDSKIDKMFPVSLPEVRRKQLMDKHKAKETFKNFKSLFESDPDDSILLKKRKAAYVGNGMSRKKHKKNDDSDDECRDITEWSGESENED